MTESQFIETLRSRAARIAVGPSTVRGRGNKGVVRAARTFLREMDLAQFSGTRAAFEKALDRETLRLKKALPVGAQHWGIARKVLNIYLRDALYTAYLRDAYRLGTTEHCYEVPLDKFTASAITALAAGGKLPKWEGVKYLSPEANAQFQAAAGREAKKRKMCRVHLDALWWSVERD